MCDPSKCEALIDSSILEHKNPNPTTLFMNLRNANRVPQEPRTPKSPSQIPNTAIQFMNWRKTSAPHLHGRAPRPRRDGARTHSKICEPELRVTETAREGRRPPSHSWRDNRDSSLTGFEFSCCSRSAPGGLKAGVPLVLDWEITRKLNRGPIVLQRLVLGNDY